MPGFAGASVAITGARRGPELAELVRRFGAVPILVPTMTTTPTPAAGESLRALDALVAGEVDWLVCLTGIGVRSMADAAAKRAPHSAQGSLFGRAATVSRGPKSTAALRRLGITPTVIAQDCTSAGVIAALEPYDLRGRQVVVQWAGEVSAPLRDALLQRGARLIEVSPYAYGLPQNVRPVRSLVRDLCRASVEAIAFTHARQVENLFLVAADMNAAETLGRTLQTRVVAAAVGRVTAAALRARSVRRVVVPEDERMGAMVAALAGYMDRPSLNRGEE